MSLGAIRMTTDDTYEVILVGNKQLQRFTLPASDPQDRITDWSKGFDETTQRDIEQARRVVWAFQRAQYPMSDNKPASQSGDAKSIRDLEKRIAEFKEIIDMQQGYDTANRESFVVTVLQTNPWRAEIRSA